MNILFIGDIVGASGRQVLFENLDKLKREYSIDFTIVNGENSAHGKGITKKIYDSFVNAGIDVVTMGNHTFSKNDIYQFIDDAKVLVRPMNMLPTDVGQAAVIVKHKEKSIFVCNLSGQVFMDQVTESPFTAMDKLLNQYKDKVDIKIVDLHAEATSEKIAFMHKYRNDVAMIVGTHTHVQTADEMVFEGCAFISDVGMTGAYYSVIGRDVEETLERMTTGVKTRFKVAENDGILCGVVVTIDDSTNRSTNIERIQIRPNSNLK